MTQLPRVLIIDDEESNLRSVTQLLRTNQYQTTIHLDPRMALELAIKKQPDVIITDWDMPHMTGIDLIKQLKAFEETQDIPIIMATGVNTASAHLEEALAAGAVDYIRKPFDKVELLARTRSALMLSQSHKRAIEAKNNEIIAKKKALVGTQMQLGVANDLLLKVKSLLAKREARQAEKLIDSSLRSNQKILEGFLEQFEQLEHGFFERMKTHLKPGEELSFAEKRWLALERMEMTAKEQAIVMSVSQDYVHVVKSKIKSKFNIERQERLVNFVKRV